MNRLVLALVVLAAVSQAAAQQSFTSAWFGSTFQIVGTNRETRQMGCAVTYSFDYDDFGVRRQRTENAFFYMAPATLDSN